MNWGKVCVCLMVLSAGDVCCVSKARGVPEGYQEPDHGSNRKFYKLGEFNDRCRHTRDCRQFGYVCRDNRTCQCDYLYVPDANKKTCVGGINQRCIYDEHCIDGAFCMNQAVCKCKESSPFELEDGLVCSDGSENRKINYWTTLVFLILMLL